MLTVSKKASFVSCIVANSSTYAKLMPAALGKAKQGKVRLVYDIPDSTSEAYPLGKVLIVTTDNISTHNVVHDGAIAYKGYCLNTLSVWGFNVLNENNIPNHLIAYGKEIFKHLCHLPITREEFPCDLHLRAVVCEKLEMVSVEFVFRENLCGGLYKDYLSQKDEYHLKLPANLLLMHKFNDTIFTPTRKSKDDEPIPYAAVIDKYPDEFKVASAAWSCLKNTFLRSGLTLVDGKLEVGLKTIDDKLVPVIADEPAVTPDSIRLVKNGEITSGLEPKWIGKENVRQYVTATWKESGQTGKAIKISGEMADKISNNSYQTPFFLITGLSLQDYWRQNHFWSQS